MLRLLSRFTSALVATLRAVTYTTPTPSTVANGEQFQASSYNIISADIQDHESRLAAIAPMGHQVLTTAQKTALIGVATGTMVYDSTIGVLQTWNGSAWVSIVERTSPPMCSFTSDSSQTYASGANVLVNATTLEIDTDNMSGGLSPATININTAGVYRVSFAVGFGAAGASVGYRAACLRINGSGNANGTSPYGKMYTVVGGTTYSQTLAQSAILNFSAGTYLNLVASQGSGSLAYTSNGGNHFEVTYIGRSL